MKRIVGIVVVFLLISCQTEIKKEDLNKLNGYWEIKQVTLSDGEKKEYKVNETIDFFELRQAQFDKQLIGFRQKVMPQFDGKFKTNGIKENIKIVAKENKFFVEYKTEYGKWQEEIIALEDSLLVLKNQQKMEYEYKRHIPFSLK